MEQTYHTSKLSTLLPDPSPLHEKRLAIVRGAPDLYIRDGKCKTGVEAYDRRAAGAGDFAVE